MSKLSPRKSRQIIMELVEALGQGGKEFDAELDRKIKKYGKDVVKAALKEAHKTKNS